MQLVTHMQPAIKSAAGRAARPPTVAALPSPPTTTTMTTTTSHFPLALVLLLFLSLFKRASSLTITTRALASGRSATNDATYARISRKTHPGQSSETGETREHVDHSLSQSLLRKDDRPSRFIHVHPRRSIHNFRVQLCARLSGWLRLTLDTRVQHGMHPR